MAFAKYAATRAAQGLVLVVVVIIVTFFLMKLAPGDPMRAMVGDYPHTDEYEQLIRAKFGMDKSLPEQLFLYLGAVARLDLGHSFQYDMPVAKIIGERIGRSLALMGSAMLFAALVGITLGVLSSLRPRSFLDNAGTVTALVGYSIPVFWLGQVLILLFAIKLKWLPAQGMQSLRESYTGFAHAVDILKHLLLPVFVLSLRYIGVNSRQTRSSMLEVMNLDYMTTARSKGLNERTVILKHAFRNALLPVVTVIGVNTGFLLTGSVLVETVFGWPGVGLLTYNAVNSRDYPILSGVFIMVSIMVLAANFLTDVVYAALDPRIRY